MPNLSNSHNKPLSQQRLEHFANEQQLANIANQQQPQNIGIPVVPINIEVPQQDPEEVPGNHEAPVEELQAIQNVEEPQAIQNDPVAPNRARRNLLPIFNNLALGIEPPIDECGGSIEEIYTLPSYEMEELWVTDWSPFLLSELVFSLYFVLKKCFFDLQTQKLGTQSKNKHNNELFYKTVLTLFDDPYTTIGKI